MKTIKDCRTMSKFKENVLFWLNEKGVSIKDFCKTIGVGKNAIYDLDLHLPTLKNAVAIANKLGVSLDYLLGRVEIQEEFKDKRVDNFFKNLEKILKTKSISKLQFCDNLHYSTDCFTRWRNGALPYLSTVIEIAEYLSCWIDDLLESE